MHTHAHNTHTSTCTHTHTHTHNTHTHNTRTHAHMRTPSSYVQWRVPDPGIYNLLVMLRTGYELQGERRRGEE